MERALVIKKFKTEGRDFAKILRSLEQFIQIVKGQNNELEQLEFKLEKK